MPGILGPRIGVSGTIGAQKEPKDKHWQEADSGTGRTPDVM